jgi:hypothetical protein
MKIDIKDAHDRLKHFTKQDFSISECCQNLIDQRPFGDYPFYIFAHARTDDDGVTQRMIWQPRLTKPSSQTNSMLFKVYPGSDIVRVIWMIPKKELWDQFEKGNLTENKVIVESIHDFKFNRKKLEAKEQDDLCDAHIDYIYRKIALQAQEKKMMERAFNINDEYTPKVIKPDFWEEPSTSSNPTDHKDQILESQF